MDNAIARAANYWNNAPRLADRTRWWQSPTILRHVNQRVCGAAIDGAHAGFHRRLAEFASGTPIAKAVSVACGNGAKEMGLIKSGLVREFHLYEISSERIAQGEKRASSLGISDHVKFHLADAFEACHDSDFDLVYWNNALHHMMDVRAAVQWSSDRLKFNGIFAMDDFVGPTRFQWTDRSLRLISKLRSCLSEELMRSPQEGKTEPRIVPRPTVEEMIRRDPSEAADSSNIVPSIRDIFPKAEFIFTGGVVYHTGMNNILCNFDEDGQDLRFALLFDDMLSEIGENQYAVALARK